MNSPSPPRHKPGTVGYIIRTEHGWHNGNITAIIVKDNGSRYIAKDDDLNEYEILKTRDFKADPNAQMKKKHHIRK